MQALTLLIELLATATSAMQAAQKVSDLIKQAKAENRDVTNTELMALFADDDKARAMLEKAIAEAGG